MSVYIYIEIQLDFDDRFCATIIVVPFIRAMKSSDAKIEKFSFVSLNPSTYDYFIRLLQQLLSLVCIDFDHIPNILKKERICESSHILLDKGDLIKVFFHMTDDTLPDDYKLSNTKIYIAIINSCSYLYNKNLNIFEIPKIDNCDSPFLKCSRKTKRFLFGTNSSKTRIPSIYQIFCNELVTPAVIWELLGFYVWYKASYKIYAGITFLFFAYEICNEILSAIKLRKYQIENTKNQKVKIIENDVLTVDSYNLLPGDVLLIEKNVELVADVILLQGIVTVTESFMTGESFPVQKNDGEILFAGSKVLQLRNTKYNDEYSAGMIIKIGAHRKNELFKLNFEDRENKIEMVFNMQLKKIFKAMILITVVICTSLMVIVIRYDSLRNVFFEVADIAFAIVNPSLFLCMSSGDMYAEKKLNKKKIKVTCRSSIKQAAFVDTIVFDKTGTITSDRLKMKCAITTEGKYNDFDSLNKTAKFCFSATNSLVITENNEYQGDFVDLAINKFTKAEISVQSEGRLIFIEGIKIEVKKVDNFNAGTSRMSVYCEIEGKKYIFRKGSFNSIKAICNEIPEEFAFLYTKYTAKGMKPIAFCYSTEEYKGENIFIGFAILTNQIRKAAFSLLENIKELNIKICTGDCLKTTFYVAKKLKVIKEINFIVKTNSRSTILFLKKYDQKNDATEILIESMNDLFLFDKKYRNRYSLILEENNYEKIPFKEFIFRKVSIFSSCKPDQKKFIVKTLNNLDNVFYIGDGCNDLPALASANTSLYLSDITTNSEIQFYGKKLGLVKEILNIGRETLIIGKMQYFYGYYVTLLCALSLINTLVFGSIMSEYCCLYCDLLAFYVFSQILFRNKCFIKKQILPAFSIIKPTVIITMELIYVFIIMTIASFYIGVGVQTGSLDRSSPHSTISFLNVSFLVLTAFIKCQFCSNCFRKNRLAKITSVVALIFWIFFVLSVVFNVELVISWLSLSTLNKNQIFVFILSFFMINVRDVVEFCRTLRIN
ncbi:hypothetical protein NUSPORA_00549 [Nucleospora cyclopteri]